MNRRSVLLSVDYASTSAIGEVTASVCRDAPEVFGVMLFLAYCMCRQVGTPETAAYLETIREMLLEDPPEDRVKRNVN